MVYIHAPARYDFTDFKNIHFYGSTINSQRDIVHKVSRTSQKSTKFELQKHTSHPQEMWSKDIRFIGFGLLLSLQNRFFSFLLFSLLFLFPTSLDFSLSDP